MVECSAVCELSYYNQYPKLNLTALIYRNVSQGFLLTPQNKQTGETTVFDLESDETHTKTTNRDTIVVNPKVHVILHFKWLRMPENIKK